MKALEIPWCLHDIVANIKIIKDAWLHVHEIEYTFVAT
jgi:hypothetical protein